MSLTQQAYERLKNEILTCELKPGDQIGQAQLRARLKMGLTPVREALQRLAHEGLVQTIPRFGYIVSPVTLGDIREIFELRGIVETAAVRLAAERADAARLDELSATAEFTYTFRDRLSYTEFLNRNAEFHGQIAVLSGNQRLAEAVARILGELLRVFHLGLDIGDNAEEMRDEHLALTAALLARDPLKAAKTVQIQITRSQERVVEALLGHTGGDLHLTRSGARR